jgi:hypothetical protein
MLRATRNNTFCDTLALQEKSSYEKKIFFNRDFNHFKWPTESFKITFIYIDDVHVSIFTTTCAISAYHH